MKIIIILDQIQAGLGGKERADTPLGGKKIALGSADNVEKLLKDVDGKIIGTFYCGTKYYENNKNIVQNKFCKMAEKMGADVVITGPTFDYVEFALMAGEIADYIRKNSTKIKVISAMAKEKNQEIIEKFKNDYPIVKMPPKGGAGLTDSLNYLALGCQILASNKDISKFKQKHCF